MASIVLPIFKQAYRTSLTYNGDDITVEDELGNLRVELDNTYSGTPATLQGGIKIYRFVEVAATAVGAVANGTVLTFSDLYGARVTDDISESHPNKVAGVGIGAITIGNKGWIQCYGHHSAIKFNNDDDAAVGDTIIVDALTDGVANTVTAGTASTHKPVGIVTVAVNAVSNTAGGFISCL